MNFTNSTGNGTIPDLNFNYFGYNPNKGLEYAVFVFFCVLTITICVMNIVKRTWYMMPIVYGGFIEIFGFGARIYETFNVHNEAGFICYLVAVLIAPTVLAAADYSLAGPIMSKGDVKVWCCTPRIAKYTFLICDIAAFFIQGIGGSIAGTGKSQSQVNLGSNIVLFGLSISLSVFVIFGFYSIILHRRILGKAHKRGQTKDDLKWTKIFWVIYANMILLTIRALYRVDEFKDKNPHSNLSSEGYFYGLDIFLMLILMLTWVFFHPSKFGITSEVKKPFFYDVKAVDMKQTDKKIVV